MKKPRVLIIVINKLGHNGITRVVQNAVTFMDRSDIDLDLLGALAIDEKTKSQFEDIGCKVYHLSRSAKNIPSYIYKLAHFIRENKYDIVHINCNSCTATIELLAAYLGGAKVRITHCHSTNTRHNIIHRLLRPLFDKLCTHRLACGKEPGQWLYRGKDFVVLNNAVDTDLFRFNASDRSEIRAQYNLGGKVAVGHVANFIPEKNHSFLIDVWKEVVERNNNYVLFLIGGGSVGEVYKQKVGELHLEDNVVFTGSVHDVQKYLSAMDLMVLPSLHEGLPCVVIEWQCSGLPCLVADTVTTNCKLTDLASFLPLNKEKWVEAILNANLIADRQEQSLKSIEEITRGGFSIKETADELKQYYFDAVGNI